MMTNEEVLDEFEKWLDRVRSLNKKAPIIVEGPSDKNSLRAIGITGPIFNINVGKSLVIRSEDISKNYHRVIIMTDWDRTGNFLCRRLKKLFKANDTRIDTDLRRDLFFLVKKEVIYVEALHTWYTNLRADHKKLKDKINSSDHGS